MLNFKEKVISNNIFNFKDKLKTLIKKREHMRNMLPGGTTKKRLKNYV